VRKTFKTTLEEQAREHERKVLDIQHALDGERDKRSHLADKLAKEQASATAYVLFYPLHIFSFVSC
jgi:hypothetical protein